MNTSALSGEEVALMHVEDHHQKVHHSYWEQFKEIVQARPIHNHAPSTYCIPECMSIVQCHSRLYTFHTVVLLDLVDHT